MSIVGVRADVYRNLHKDCYSVKCMDSESMYPYGRVIEHESRVLVAEPEFVVQDAGLRETRETDVKTVHAFVRGDIEATGDDAGFGDYRAWSFDYRPLDDRYRRFDRPFIFHDPPNGRPIDHLNGGPDRVLLTECGQYGLFDYSISA